MQVVIIDPCLACAEGFATWLRQAGYDVSLLQRIDEAMSLAQEQSVAEALVVIGPTTPTQDAFAFCHAVQANKDNPRKIILILPDADDFTLQCDAAFVGVAACLPIAITAEVFLEAVTHIDKGCSLIQQDVMAQAFLPIGLTPAELDVLKIMAEGATDAQIAYKLHKGHQTVRTQIKTIFEKLQVNTRQKAIYRARLRGLV